MNSEPSPRGCVTGTVSCASRVGGLIVIAVVLTFMAETVGPLHIILGIVGALLLVVAALR